MKIDRPHDLDGHGRIAGPFLTKQLSWRPRLSAACLTIALLASGGISHAASRVIAWGDTNYDLTLSARVTQIAAGSFHSVALGEDGLPLAWGDDKFNQTQVPAQVTAGQALALAAGNVHNLALLRDGSVVAWGPNVGQHGDHGQCSVSGWVGPGRGSSGGAVHSLALRRDGSVVPGVRDRYGQSSVPSNPKPGQSVAGGMYHSLAFMRRWHHRRLGR